MSTREVTVDTEPRRPFYTVNGLAAYLGLSTRTVWQMLSDGTLPSYRFEGARRISPTDVEAYIASSRTENARR